MSAIKIVLDITRLVEEGKLTAQEAERLQALARRDTGSLAINVLMSFGAVAVAAGIIALEPAFTTGAALGVALVAMGLGIRFFAADQWSLLGTATTIIGALTSRHVGQAYQQLAIIFARVSLILVNFGFWIGSLWGDYPGQTWAQGEDYRLWSNRGEAWRATHLHVPEIAFIVGWAILIIAVGAWAARTNRRWVVTTAAVFGAIEFYTQWFERLGAEHWAIIVAGLTVVAFAVALWRYNLTSGRPATVAA